MINSARIYFPTAEAERYFINSIWRLQEYNTRQCIETILPKGTVEIIFNLSDNIIYSNPATGVKINLPCCFVNGINYKPFNIVKEGQQTFLGIQLNAMGLKILFNISAEEFNDNIVEGCLACKSLEALSGQLFLKKTFEEQIEIIRKWICQKISDSKYSKSINQIYNLFYRQNRDELTVKKLCGESCVSDRQFRRLAIDWLGTNPETFLRYNKYISALHLLHRSDSSLTQLGLQAGYYDQSHFIREFKYFTGLTPKEYKAAGKGLPGHIVG